MSTLPEKHVWIFNGDDGSFPGGAFSTKELAEEWIKRNRLSGTLTCYPLDEGCMDWAIRTGVFNVSRPNNAAKQKDPRFIGSFSSASQEHSHWENGEL
jgi:hypothetical protein